MSPVYPPSVTCWGAARSVTGSMHLVDGGGYKILLDCGIVRGPRSPVLSDGRHFPFEPAELNAVVLTHSHVDHCGNLPRLIRHGFRGPIYCTPQTREITALMLADSARIQAEEAHVLRIIGVPGGKEIQPGYTGQDVEQVRSQYVAVPYQEPHEILPGVTLLLANAGHILGSAMAHLRFAGHGIDYSMTFTGDMGRPGLPLLNGPDPVPPADLLLSESTNGGRSLPPLPEAVEKLEALVRQTVERGGKVVIPAFSTGRIQVLVHYLAEARQAGRIPDVPVIIDSPLASDITEVYRHYARRQMCRVGKRDASDAATDAEPGIEYVRTLEASRELSQHRQPSIILAPGGMCEGTRIQNHLRETVDDPRCTIALVSYQAPHSVGRRFLEPGPTVRFQGRKWNRWADIVELSGFSGHPDERELLSFLTPLAGKVKKVRLIHGEVENSSLLAKALRERGFTDVGVPLQGEAISFV